MSELHLPNRGTDYHCNEGGTGITNFGIADYKYYDEALRKYNREGLFIGAPMKSWFHDLNMMALHKDSELHPSDLSDFRRIFDAIKYPDKIKETTKMTTSYEVIKPFTIIDIERKKPCSEEFVELLTECIDLGRSLEQYFNTWNSMKRFKTFTNNIFWLVNKGFIKKVSNFKPFTLELKIKDEDELLNLWHRTNAAKIGDHYSYGRQPQPDPESRIIKQDLWKQIDDQMCRLNGVIPKGTKDLNTAEEVKGLWDPQL